MKHEDGRDSTRPSYTEMNKIFKEVLYRIRCDRATGLNLGMQRDVKLEDKEAVARISLDRNNRIVLSNDVPGSFTPRVMNEA